MKLALHRSLTFWSGLLVMAFICWAWWDSTRASIYGAYRGWELRNLDCGVALGWYRGSGPDRAGRHVRPKPVATSPEEDPFYSPPVEAGMRITWPRYFRKTAEEDIEEAMMRYESIYGHYRDDPEEEISTGFLGPVFGPAGDWMFYLPYWCLLAGVLPLWLGTLLRRWRWRARLKKREPIPAP